MGDVIQHEIYAILVCDLIYIMSIRDISHILMGGLLVRKRWKIMIVRGDYISRKKLMVEFV